MTLKQMERQLQKQFGNKFFQFAFYVDNRKLKRIGKYWIKVETEASENEYKAYQIRDIKSLDDGFKKLLRRIKKTA